VLRDEEKDAKVDKETEQGRGKRRAEGWYFEQMKVDQWICKLLLPAQENCANRNAGHDQQG
jgi:hypothetical protein